MFAQMLDTRIVVTMAILEQSPPQTRHTVYGQNSVWHGVSGGVPTCRAIGAPLLYSCKARYGI